MDEMDEADEMGVIDETGAVEGALSRSRRPPCLREASVPPESGALRQGLSSSARSRRCRLFGTPHVKRIPQGSHGGHQVRIVSILRMDTIHTKDGYYAYRGWILSSLSRDTMRRK